MPSLPVTRMPCRSSTPKPAHSARSPRPTCWPTLSSTAEPTPYQSLAARLPAPAAVIGPDAPIGQAARRLSAPSHLQLCVVDHDMRLVGILTRRNLLT